MEKGKAWRLLPKLGDRRWERPTIDTSTGHYQDKAPQRCVVVDVRPEHLWYTVEFENGIRESYKVPKIRRYNQQGGELYD